MIVGRRLDLNFVDKEVHDAYASRQVSFWWSFSWKFVWLCHYNTRNTLRASICMGTPSCYGQIMLAKHWRLVSANLWLLQSRKMWWMTFSTGCWRGGTSVKGSPTFKVIQYAQAVCLSFFVLLNLFLLWN